MCLCNAVYFFTIKIYFLLITPVVVVLPSMDLIYRIMADIAWCCWVDVGDFELNIGIFKAVVNIIFISSGWTATYIFKGVTCGDKATENCHLTLHFLGSVKHFSTFQHVASHQQKCSNKPTTSSAPTLHLVTVNIVGHFAAKDSDNCLRSW